MTDLQASQLTPAMEEACLKAWNSLARYKFVMFGYWAGVWVELNRASGFKQPNPFSRLVQEARNELRR